MGARTLLIAARAVQEPGGKTMDEAACLKEGQFMSGADAGAISRVMTLAELHQELAAGPFTLAHPHLAPLQGPAVRRAASPDAGGERVAVTGMALVNALGNSPREIWEASLAMRSGIIEVPPEKWDHSFYYDPTPGPRRRPIAKWGPSRISTSTAKSWASRPRISEPCPTPPA